MYFFPHFCPPQVDPAAVRQPPLTILIVVAQRMLSYYCCNPRCLFHACSLSLVTTGCSLFKASLKSALLKLDACVYLKRDVLSMGCMVASPLTSKCKIPSSAAPQNIERGSVPLMLHPLLCLAHFIWDTFGFFFFFLSNINTASFMWERTKPDSTMLHSCFFSVSHWLIKFSTLASGTFQDDVLFWLWNWFAFGLLFFMCVYIYN